MPRLSVLLVRAALIYLALGITIGALLLWNKGVPLHPLLWRLLPAHMEFLLLGWTVQLAMGIAFWILPRWQSKRGNVRFVWAAFVLLNAGIWLVVLPAWFGAQNSVVILGRGLETTAVGAFALHAWPRVKPWVENAT
ncbi:MAG: hypothetical protein H3C34_21150 [Caldilineaceae bacterium]|nr:hypothetical protein [Caldilineaceae bacterium]